MEDCLDDWWEGEAEGSHRDGALDIIRVQCDVPGHIESGLGAELVCNAAANCLDLLGW